MKHTLDYCYHTHTTRCGHAYGKDEEYVLAAIEKGFKVLGFSDHIFFPNIHQPGMRGNFDQLGDYIQSIRSLQFKYADKIQILLGFEAEYYPFFDSYYRELFSKHHFDYLICGQHFRFENQGFPIYYASVSDPKLLYEYAEGVIAAMKSGFFSYIAHPDLFMLGYKQGWDGHTEAISRLIIEASNRYGVPLELNLGGANGRGMMTIAGEFRYPYPYPKFWELVGVYKAKTIIGIDAHSPNQIRNSPLDVVFKLIEMYDLNYQDRLMIK